jgi:hypothetical protein
MMRLNSVRLEYNFDAAVLLVPKGLVHLWRVINRNGVRNDERGIYFSRLDFVQQGPKIAVDMRLTSLDGQTFIHERAERYLVQKSDVNARDRQRSTFPAAHDDFT